MSRFWSSIPNAIEARLSVGLRFSESLAAAEKERDLLASKPEQGRLEAQAAFELAEAKRLNTTTALG